MDINSNLSYVSSYHPVNVQAGLRTEAEAQGRGPDSVPPTQNSSNSQGANTQYDNTKTQGRNLDTYA